MTAISELRQGKAERIDQLEAEMLKLPQQTCGVRHIFAPGLYIREVSIPADSYVVSHAHRHPHLNVFVQGSGTMIMCNGTHQKLQAPMTFVGQPGRKVGYVETDLVWLNVFPTDETDIDKLEEMYFDKSEQFGQAQEAARIEYNPLLLEHDRRDYGEMLADWGITEAVAREVSESNDDLIPLPHGAYKFKVGKSSIEGKGIIATARIGYGEFIGPARIGDKRTPLGRYTNHSGNPNAKFVNAGDRVILVALRTIEGCRGGLDGDEITVDYRDAVALALNIGAST